MAFIKVKAAEQTAFNKIRLTFSKPVPYLTPTTGLQMKNYAVFLGSTPIETVRISPVEDRFDCVEIELKDPLQAGTYSVKVFNLVNQAGQRLDGDQATVTLKCSYKPPPITRAVQATVEQSFRRYMSPLLNGPNFRALLGGFAVGEVANQENARLAKNQMFVSSASEQYLDRIASGYGITRPDGLGMRDETFRSYATRIYNYKVTEHSLYEMIRVFYGIDGVQAYVQNNGLPTGSVTDGDTLILKFDGNKQLTIDFFRNEFGDYQNPTQVEASILISQKIQEQKVGGFAIVAPPPKNEPPHLRIYSSTMGLRSSVEVVGGTALTWLNLSVQKQHLRSRKNVSYIGRDNTDTMRIFLHAISDAVVRTPSNASYLGTNGWTFDPSNRFALTSAETVLDQQISQGATYASIRVGNVSSFDPNGGYIVIGFGYDYEQGPIKYSRVNPITKTIYLDNFICSKTVTPTLQNPAYVTALNGAVGYDRANLSQTFGTPSGVPGSLYSTNSNLARIVCANTLLGMIDAGSKHKIQIVYPDGLGLLYGEALETSLIPSDIARIYGPNDVLV
jgi:hypothetical protein